MSTQTLMLTPWMAPHRVISWQRAIVLLYLGKVEVNEKTCVGCKLCEEVCGWEGIYIMTGKDKGPFLESLGYDVENA